MNLQAIESVNAAEVRRSGLSSVPPLVLGRDESADLLRISTRQLDNLIATGELRPVRIGARVLLRWKDLCEYIDRKAQEVT